QDLETNPRCALTFYWSELERQVRVEGQARRVTRAESEAYFRTRPKGSKLGAWASQQSETVASRDALEAKLSELQAKYAGQDEIPVPEFWEGRPNRMHDRIRYRRKGETEWVIDRLSP